MNKYFASEEEYEQPIDFLGIFIKYVSYWKWFIASLIVCLIFAEIYLKFAIPSYEVKTSVLLKDDTKGGGSLEMKAFKEMGLFTIKNNVDNELEELNKSILVEQVIRELGLYASYTKIGTLQVFNSLGLDPRYTKFVSYKEKILYGSECPILVQLPDVLLNNLKNAIEFDILIRPYGVYEFSGTYNKNKYNVKASISDHFVMLPFGRVNISRGDFRPGQDMIVKVELQGACGCCPHSIMTLKNGVEQAVVKAIPGIVAVESI